MPLHRPVKLLIYIHARITISLVVDLDVCIYIYISYVSPLLRERVDFSKFSQKEGSKFYHEKGGVGKVGGVVLKRGVSLTLTNLF